MVPVGKKSAASFPSISATRASRRRTVGSPSSTSSPTSASAMARRMAGVGRVTVSERRSIGMRGAGKGEMDAANGKRHTEANRYAVTRPTNAFAYRQRKLGLGDRDRWRLDYGLLRANHRLVDDDGVLLRADDRRVDRVGLRANAHTWRRDRVRIGTNRWGLDLILIVPSLLAGGQWQREHRGAEQQLVTHWVASLSGAFAAVLATCAPQLRPSVGEHLALPLSRAPELVHLPHLTAKDEDERRVVHPEHHNDHRRHRAGVERARIEGGDV